jgi:hypothetical protein
MCIAHFNFESLYLMPWHAILTLLYCEMIAHQKCVFLRREIAVKHRM